MYFLDMAIILTGDLLAIILWRLFYGDYFMGSSKSNLF
jgi:hypothetical protein